MSSKKMGLRRVGIVGLSTLVATSMMSLSGAPAFAAAGDYTSLSAPYVAQGQVAAPAGNLTLEFVNGWATGAAQTFTIGGNVCTSAAGIARAVEFNAAPTMAVTDAAAPANVDSAPTLVQALSSSSASCDIAGVKDVLTVTAGLPPATPNLDTWLLTLSNIKYNVGATRAPGDISVTTAGGLVAAPTPATRANAVIPALSLTNTPTARVAALPSATGVSLGTQALSEGSAGDVFTTALRNVTLTPTSGALTIGVTPTITAPTGYTVTHPATTIPGSYTFSVTGPATPIRATVTVAGLTITAPAAATVISLNASVDTAVAVTAGPTKVVNVVTYNARTGGATRYETAAALFDSKFGSVALNNGFAVLARGDLYPDALSANYLAGKLGTGTLLTPVATLSSAARLSILNGDVATVYIMGGTGAVSQAVENQIEALHVGNVPTAPFIITVRLGGADRYATNLLVNENAFTPETTVLLASGLNFPDALAFGPIASGRTMPLILTRGTTLGTHELAQLSDFDPDNVVIGGGTGVVSAAIATSLAADYTVVRLAGADRTLTAAAIANWATVGVSPYTGVLAAQGFASDRTYVATGNLFPDSLAAGPVAGANNDVILLTYSGLGAGIPSYLGPKDVGAAGLGLGVSTLHALGLTGAVSAATMKSAAATISVP